MTTLGEARRAEPTRRASAPAAPSDRAYDIAAVRAEFPTLAQRVHGRRLAYLDSAASTLKPRRVIERVSRFYAEEYSNIHRGVHLLSETATRLYEEARDRVARFIGARESREVVFCRGTTEAINLVAQTFGRREVGAGDEVLVSAIEHHANIVPWQMLCREKGAALKVIPVDDRGVLRLEALEHLLTERTRIVAVGHVSNALGTVNPVAEIARRAKARGIPVLVDGAQAVLHMPVDVAALGCDFYAFSGHKLYGPTGIGALYGRAEVLGALPPWQGGGDMIRQVTFEETTFADIPQRFEAGTPHIAGAIGLAEAIGFVEEVGLGRIAAHEARVVRAALERLREVPGLRLIGEAPERAGVISFDLEGVHPHDLGTILDHHGVAVRAGHHCAQPVMERFGLAATTRASFGAYSDLDDLDPLVEGLLAAREVFG